MGVVTLDLTVDDELESEGLARDVVRLIQAERRDAGLHVSDCIALEVVAPAEMKKAIEEHRLYVAEQTLAVIVEVTEGPELSVAVTRAPCPDA